MNNKEVADLLYKISIILEILGEKFKPVAYRRASRNISIMKEDITKISDLTTIPGVGKGIAKKIKEFLEKKSSDYYKNLKKKVPVNVEELMLIPGIGPKTIMKLYEKLNVTNKKELLKAAKNRKIRKIKGLGPIVEKNIIENIKYAKKRESRRLLIEGLESSDYIIQELKKSNLFKKATTAGSIRRMKETIGDVDIICTSNKPKKLMDFFTELLRVKKVLAKGETKSSVLLFNNLQVDLRVVKPEQYGSALQHFTGNKDHNISLRKLAKTKGLKINEYGVFRKKTRIAGRTEKSVYDALNMQFIPPELRQNKGEIKKALNNKIPKLVRLKDIKGEFHIHSKWSDGLNTIKEIAEYARKILKYEYVGIADHANLKFMKHNITSSNMKKRAKEIKDLNNTYKNFKILNCIEANIKRNGQLDFNKNLLKNFDLVIASIHYGFKMPKKEMTNRLLKALDNEHVKILGHLTGRKLLSKPGINFDFKKVVRKAVKKGVLIEIDSFPDRLDVGDNNARIAKNLGAKFAINTDAHQTAHLKYMNLGLGVARRAGLSKKHVINTRKKSDLPF